MNIEIANRLVELRKKHGFSQEELAARLGLSRQAVSKWERAEASPDTDNLILLSRLYGVSVDELLGIAAEPEPPERGVKLTVNGKPVRFRAEDGLYFSFGDDDDEDDAGDKPKKLRADAHIDLDDDNGGDDSDDDDDTEPKPFLKAFPYPAFIAILYLALGFVWNLWHPGWILFLTIPIYYSIVNWVCGKRHRSFWRAFPYAVFVTVAFLVLGCVWNLWHPAWALFLTLPIYYPIARNADKRYRKRRAAETEE